MSYETDFYAWTQDQALALRRLLETRANLPVAVDLEHVAEEIEDLGNDVLAKIEGLVVQVLAHLLKLGFCPDPLPRNHWEAEVTTRRATIRRRAKRSKSALARLDLGELYRDATAALRKEYRGAQWIEAVPDTCPFALDEVLDEGFVPDGQEREAFWNASAG